MTYRAQYSTVPAPPSVAIGMVCSECAGLVPESEQAQHDDWHARLRNQLATAMSGPQSWGELEITEELARQLLRRMLEMQQEE